MAVFTPITFAELAPWIKQFPLGRLKKITEIPSGIENSNFFIDTEKGEYVLTIFEKLNFTQLPFYLNLMRHLAERGVRLPFPIANRQNKILHSLKDKPTALVTKLAGQWVAQPAPLHCSQVGEMLAKMHLAGREYGAHLDNLRGLAWWEKTTPCLLPYLSESLQQVLANEVQLQNKFAKSPEYALLPRGPIHADLFRNNVMFENDTLSGFFDFYFAGVDTWLFDVAVTLNDWCIDLTTGVIDTIRARALQDAYHAVRPFTREEMNTWPMLLRAAALRFWVSRLYDFYLPRNAKILTAHDPTHFERILLDRIHTPCPQLIL